jgi:hypothetical protein
MKTMMYDETKSLRSMFDRMIAESDQIVAITDRDFEDDDATTIDKWLDANGPLDLNEVRSLIRMIKNRGACPDARDGYYGVMVYNGTVIVFGPKNMLMPGSEAAVSMLLQRLDGLRQSPIHRRVE